MTLKEQVQQITATTYFDAENHPYHIKLDYALLPKEIYEIRQKCPQKMQFEELAELLNYSGGFLLQRGFLSEIRFDDMGIFWFKELLQFCLKITGDGAGNYWVQEIKQNGNWGAVYFVSHDPGVIIKQADSLSDFLSQIEEYAQKGDNSFLVEVYNNKAMEIYKGKGGLLVYKEVVNSSDVVLREFVASFDEKWVFGDLRNAKKGEGFCLEASYRETIRCEEELIWALKKPTYQSPWARLMDKIYPLRPKM